MEEISEPEVKFDPSFNLDLNMFSHEAIFKQKIKVLSEEEFTITGSLEYMCCDDERCLPPTEEEFSFHHFAEARPQRCRRNRSGVSGIKQSREASSGLGTVSDVKISGTLMI